MERGESRYIDQLRDLREALGTTANGDASEAVQGFVQLVMRSRNPTLTAVMREALFYKPIVMEAENPASITSKVTRASCPSSGLESTLSKRRSKHISPLSKTERN
jgi:hypothetical protein